MNRSERTLGKREVFFGGATVFSALILLGAIAVSVRPAFPSTVVGLGLAGLLLALTVGAGAWYERRWLRVGSWIATVILMGLGFPGSTVGPQISRSGASPC